MRRPIEMGNPLLFFTMVIVLFPLGLGPAPDKLAIFAPGVLWITALLSNLLTSDAVFRSDFDDGSLEQLVLAPQPLFLSALAYILAHWLTTGLLLALVSPIFALMLNLPVSALSTLIVSLLLGTAVLSLLGGIGAALTVATVSAAPIPPSRLSTAVPNSKLTMSVLNADTGRFSMRANIGDTNANSKPVVSQWAKIYASAERNRGCGARTSCSKLPSSKSLRKTASEVNRLERSAVIHRTPGAKMANLSGAGPRPSGNKTITIVKNSRGLPISMGRRIANNNCLRNSSAQNCPV